MDIWEILGIEPTTDKKSIKKAYAAKTKEIHPEEKPEEFKQLHRAYQAALGYAAFVLKGNLPDCGQREGRIEENTAEGIEADNEENIDGDDTDNGELFSFFTDNQERHQQRVDAFTKYWEALKSSYSNPDVLVWWKKYLASEEFQDIRYHPQVLHLLAEEMQHKYDYIINEIKMLLWDAYGFQEDEENIYRGKLQKLWKYLNPTSIKRQKKERAQRIFRGVAIIVILLFCIWGAYMTGDGKVLFLIVAALLYYARHLLIDIQE